MNKRSGWALHAARVACFLGLYSMLVCASWAQVNKKPATDVGGGGLEIANLIGKLDAVQVGNLKILDAAKAETFVVLSNTTTVKFSGQAKPTWLPSGMMARFSSRFDQQGNAQAPLKSMEVFIPEPNRRMSEDERRNQTPGVYPEGSTLGAATKNLFNDKKVDSKKVDEKKGDKKGDKKSDKKATGKNDPDSSQGSAGTIQGYRVVGQIVGVRNGTLVVNAAGQRLSVELDPNVTIKVMAPNAMFAMQGDEVKVSGLRNPKQPQFVQAESIEIKAAKPLGSDGSQAPKNARSPKNSKTANTATNAAKKGTEKVNPKAPVKPGKQPK